MSLPLSFHAQEDASMKMNKRNSAYDYLSVKFKSQTVHTHTHVHWELTFEIGMSSIGYT